MTAFFAGLGDDCFTMKLPRSQRDWISRGVHIEHSGGTPLKLRFIDLDFKDGSKIRCFKDAHLTGTFTVSSEVAKMFCHFYIWYNTWQLIMNCTCSWMQVIHHINGSLETTFVLLIHDIFSNKEKLLLTPRVNTWEITKSTLLQFLSYDKGK